MRSITRHNLSLLLVGVAELAGVMAQAPPAGAVTINAVGANGSGCRNGGNVSINGTKVSFDIAPFTAVVGPGALPSDQRKNCQATIHVLFPAGYQLSIIDSTHVGHVNLAASQTGSVGSQYFFSGTIGEDAIFRNSFSGPINTDYTFTASGEGGWTTCGTTEAILNINTDVRITSSDRSVPGSVEVKPFVGEMDIIGLSNWKTC